MEGLLSTGPTPSSFCWFPFFLFLSFPAGVGQGTAEESFVFRTHELMFLRIVVIFLLLCFSSKEHSAPYITMFSQHWKMAGSAGARVSSGMSLPGIVIWSYSGLLCSIVKAQPSCIKDSLYMRLTKPETYSVVPFHNFVMQ